MSLLGNVLSGFFGTNGVDRGGSGGKGCPDDQIDDGTHGSD